MGPGVLFSSFFREGPAVGGRFGCVCFFFVFFDYTNIFT